MLEQAEACGHAAIVRWQPHGRAFKIYDNKCFEGDPPALFQQSNKVWLVSTSTEHVQFSPFETKKHTTTHCS
jgi:hypothetical protein